MKPEERRERIAAVVREASRASVDELATMLDISRETVRRDLALLSEQGVLRKVHGGAVHFQTARESPLDDRKAAARPEKMAIARRAAELFEPGDSLLIDSGTTTTYFAEALGRSGSFAVITNSVAVADELWKAPHRSDVYLLGGKYFGDGQEVLGPLAVEQIRALHADHVVLTIGAMDTDGKCAPGDGPCRQFQAQPPRAFPDLRPWPDRPPGDRSGAATAFGRRAEGGRRRGDRGQPSPGRCGLMCKVRHVCVAPPTKVRPNGREWG
jgi:DeoR family transcriptional regulator, glycerol-3-phosphate regulon repressor